MKVLVVAPSPLVRAEALAALAREGHAVESVDGALPALRRARAWAPDVLVTPVALPGMDGFALTAAVKAEGRLRETVVLLLGPAQDAVAPWRAARLGARYGASPLALDDLEAALRATPRGRSSAGAAPGRRRGMAAGGEARPPTRANK